MPKKIKRLRIFAGPNGSGKSTLFNDFSQNYNTGHFINADEIEKELSQKGFINFDKFNLKIIQFDFDNFLQNKNTKSLIDKSKSDNHKILLTINDNFIVDYSSGKHNYEGSLISSFIREKLIQNNQSFSFETVMSHVSKLEEIEFAKNQDYKTYLYFICTDNSELNVSRVENRVKKGQHDVSKDAIIRRYKKTLENLFPAIEICDKVYLFDNSNEKSFLIAEIESANTLKLHVNEKHFPNWFKNYVLNHFIS